MMERAKSTKTTIEDVARYAGVSTATVSRLLNGTGTVATSTAERIYTAIHDLNYVAHAAARGLASQKTHTIGLIVPDTSSYFLASLLRGVNETLVDSQYNTLIFVTPSQIAIQAGHPLPLGEHNTDGLIIFNQLVHNDTLRLMERRGFPLLLLFREAPPESDIPCVNFENRNAAYQLTKHLIVTCGRRRIAFLRGPDNFPDSLARENGFRQAMAEHDLAVDESLVGMGGFRAQIAEQTVRGWMAEGREMDAIFAADDNMAMGAITALRESGKRIPEDVAVVGFNDDLLSRYISPSLTTIYAPAEEVGRLAAENMLALIDQRPIRQDVTLETRLVIRQSCGASLVTNSAVN